MAYESSQSQASKPEESTTSLSHTQTDYYKLKKSLKLPSGYTTLMSEVPFVADLPKEINLGKRIKDENIEKSLLDPWLNPPHLTPTDPMDTPNQSNQDPTMPSPNPENPMHTPDNPSGSVTFDRAQLINWAQVIIAAAAVILSLIFYFDRKIENVQRDLTNEMSNTNNRIDILSNKLSNKIDSGNQEIRNLINSGIRDYNNRIDNTNARIDQVYQAPIINPS